MTPFAIACETIAIVAATITVGLLAAEFEACCRAWYWSGRTVEQWVNDMGDALADGVRGAALWVIGVEEWRRTV